ncbi:MAG TPA: hypothetical protein VG826_10675 [Pirellulales bacterium]|nr:hypothetical protein [Pirellulales bacterium]
MKLRIKGNSVRLRLDRKDLAELLDAGRVDDGLRLGQARAFTYSIVLGEAQPGRPRVDYLAGNLVITIHRDDVVGWQARDLVGFEHLQPVEGGVVRVIVEKDFACIDRPAGQEPDDAWAFPNPSTAC